MPDSTVWLVQGGITAVEKSWVGELLLTLISVGLAGFLGAFGWAMTNLVVTPIQTVRSTLRAAYEDRWYYSSAYWNANVVDAARWAEASDKLRRHAAKLDSVRYEYMIGRKVWQWLRMTPTDDHLQRASRGLTLLSNAPAMFRADNMTALKALWEAESAVDEAVTGKKRPDIDAA